MANLQHGPCAEATGPVGGQHLPCNACYALSFPLHASAALGITGAVARRGLHCTAVFDQQAVLGLKFAR